MKKIFKIFLMLMLFGKIYAQTENLNSTKYQFAKGVFEKNYTKQNFEKFKGKISIENGITIKFDEKTLVIYNTSEVYKAIFFNGIFYPNIITGNQISIIKSEKEIESLTTSEKVFYNMTRTDSLQIANFNELKALNPNPKIKRFVFWLYNIGSSNPTECYIELENQKATEKTILAEFIKNAKLTFYYRGTIII